MSNHLVINFNYVQCLHTFSHEVCSVTFDSMRSIQVRSARKEKAQRSLAKRTLVDPLAKPVQESTSKIKHLSVK